MRRIPSLLAALVLTQSACTTVSPPDVSILQVSPAPADVPSSPPSDTAAAASPVPSPSDAAASPSASPPPSDTAAAAAPVAGGRNLSYYEVNPANLNAGAEPADWLDVSGADWLSHDPWPVTDKAWQMPAFSSQQYAFRRYGGDAFHGDGAMPDLYQVYVRIRPKDAEGTIAVCPYYLSPTKYALVLLDLKAKNVSLWEMNGATPSSSTTGAYDLSQNHRGWRPLPNPDHDGGYSIKIKVNTQWNSMAVWVGDTWIDTPKVASVTDQPHYVAIRTSGTPQEILKIGINRFTDPLQAR